MELFKFLYEELQQFELKQGQDGHFVSIQALAQVTL
jgi:hypothetical protein